MSVNHDVWLDPQLIAAVIVGLGAGVVIAFVDDWRRRGR